MARGSTLRSEEVRLYPEQTSRFGVLVETINSVGEITLIVVAADIGELVHPASSERIK
jgi:hypothetical protein